MQPSQTIYIGARCSCSYFFNQYFIVIIIRALKFICVRPLVQPFAIHIFLDIVWMGELGDVYNKSGRTMSLKWSLLCNPVFIDALVEQDPHYLKSIILWRWLLENRNSIQGPGQNITRVLTIVSKLEHGNPWSVVINSQLS